MKTAEEIAAENDGFTILRNDHRSIELIESIHAQGMRDAAEIVCPECLILTMDSQSNFDMKKAILSEIHANKQ